MILFIKAYCFFLYKQVMFNYCRTIIKHISSLGLIQFKFIKLDENIIVEMMYTTVGYSRSNSICDIIITAENKYE